MSDLKPCPFCGGEPSVSPPPDSYDAYWHISCECMEADFESPGHSQDYAKAVASWNRRAPRFSPEEREALERGIYCLEEIYLQVPDPPTVELCDESAAKIRKMLEER